MKTLKFTCLLSLLFISSTVFISCTKDDTTPEEMEENQGPTDIEESEGATLDELITYEGQIGINLSARNIVRKGYNPTTAIISTKADSETINETIDIDPDTNIGQLVLELADLSEQAKNDLEGGVAVSVEIKDANNATLVSQDFAILPFSDNPSNTEINANSLIDLTDNVTFRPDKLYYMQIVAPGDLSSNTACFVNYIPSQTYGVPIELRGNYDFADNNTERFKFEYAFYPIPNETGSLAIVSNVQDSNGMHLFLRIHPSGYLYQDNSRHVETTPLETLPAENRFKIRKDEATGLFTITPVSNNTILRKRIVSGATRLHNFGDDNDEIAYFRILTKDIDWDIQTLDVSHLPPILPAPTSSFAFNKTLTNCTEGLLTDEIGVERTITTTAETAFEESFSMTSRETVGGSLTVGVETEASFFGNGVTVSAEATASYETETEISNTSTTYNAEINEVSETLFSARNLEVPAGTAAKVYDAYQVYENVEVPFVQRYLIQGTYQTGEGALSGQEILTQFSFTNANGGVVTEIGSTFIKITVRGTNIIGNMVDAVSRADAADPMCN